MASIGLDVGSIDGALSRVASSRQEAKPVQQMHGPVYIDLRHTPAGVLDYLNTHLSNTYRSIGDSLRIEPLLGEATYVCWWI
jgi:hypothetical protein